MIQLTCTQCHAVLMIDDAFAGGVCRCQHCGTIQTVPAHLKGNATPQPKTLYQNEAARAVGATGVPVAGGLDDLASAVASSGLTSGLTSPHLRAKPPQVRQAPAPPPPPPPRVAEEEAPAKKSPLLLILVGAGVLILALIGVIVYLIAFHGKGNTPDQTPGQTTTTGPTFCGETVEGNRIIYLLDDGNSIENDFDPIKAATYASINSLGSGKQFAVVMWNNGNDFSFPASGFADADSAQLKSLQGSIQDFQATGQSHLASALNAAVSRGPSTIIIVTAKAQLDPEDETAVGTARDNAGGKIKFYAMTIGGADNQFLKATAEATGGKYKHLSSQEIRAVTP